MLRDWDDDGVGHTRVTGTSHTDINLTIDYYSCSWVIVLESEVEATIESVTWRDIGNSFHVASDSHSLRD